MAVAEFALARPAGLEFRSYQAVRRRPPWTNVRVPAAEMVGTEAEVPSGRDCITAPPSSRPAQRFSGRFALLTVGAIAAVLVGTSIASAQAGGGDRSSRPYSDDYWSRLTPGHVSAEELLAEDAARRRWRASGAAHSERMASRDRHRGLGPDGARGAALEHYESTVRRPSWRRPELAPDLELVRYRGTHSFTFKARGNGANRGVVFSTVPLVVERGGVSAPLDLAVQDLGAYFAPRRDLAELRVTAAGLPAFSFARTGIKVTVDGAAPSPGQRLGETVFFANVAADTDFFIKPTPTGAQTFHHLRSPDSPEVLGLRLELPAGARARSLAGSRTEVIDARDEPLALVGRAVAWDAQGAPVAVETELSPDGQILIRVPHRNREYAYPILVDPYVEDRFAWEAAAQTRFNSEGKGWGSAFNGWNFSSDDDNGFHEFAGDGYLGGGLYNRRLPEAGWHTFLDGWVGLWWFRAPGTSRIWQADWQNVSQDNSPSSSTCVIAGVKSTLSLDDSNWDPPTPGDRAINCSQNFYDLAWGRCLESPCDGSTGGTPGNYSVFGVKMVGTAQRDYFMAHMGAATVFVRDADAPTVSLPNTGWTNDSAAAIQATATDSGLGVQSVTFSAPNFPSWSGATTASLSCNGEASESNESGGGQCPQNPSPSQLKTTVGNLADGIHTVNAVARDVVGNPSATASGLVKVDRQPPDLILEGSLAANADEPLIDGVYQLEASAADGDADQPASGVSRIDIAVDGVAVPPGPPQGCTGDNCALTRDWTFDTEDYSDGVHTIQVTAIDRAGNTISDLLEVEVAHTPNLAPETIDLSSAGVTLRIDGAAAGHLAGQSVADVGDLNGDDLSDYAIGAPKASSLGRTSNGSVYVVYGRSSGGTVDLAALGTGGFRINGATSGDLAGNSVTSAGDVNGDGIEDLALGAPETDGSLFSLPAQGKVHIVYGATASPDIDLAALGNRGFTITGPLPGNEPLVGLTYHRPPTLFGDTIGGAKTGTVGTAGDVNGDGIDDLVIGASSEAHGSALRAGSAYVIFGYFYTGTLDLDLHTGWGFEIEGGRLEGFAGYDVALAGDVNTDGRADILVSAPGESASGQASGGRAYVVFGKTDTNVVRLTSLGAGGFQVDGAAADRIGFSVAGVGDIDRDGRDDLALGGRGAYVVYGKPDSSAVSLAGSYAGYRLASPPADTSDLRVARAGELNGDAVPDMTLGAVPSSSPASARTSAYVVYGLRSRVGERASGGLSLASLVGQQGSAILGSAVGDRTGWSLDAADIATIGAEDGGVPGIAVGAPASDHNGRADSGSVYIMSSDAFAGATPPPPATGAAFRPRTRFRGATWRVDRRYRAMFLYDNGYYASPYVRENDQSIFDLPRFRRTQRRTLRDGGGFRKVENGGNANATFQHLTRKDERYAIRDSEGNPFAYLEQKSTNADLFVVYRQDETEYDRTDLTPDFPDQSQRTMAYLQLQGRGCMKTDALEEQYAIVALTSGNATFPGHSTYPPNRGENGKNIGIRGFITRDALPPRYRGVVNRYDLDCNKVRLQKGTSRLDVKLSAAPNFTSTEIYQGGTSYRSCFDPGTPPPQRGTPRRNDCATPYTQYYAPPGLATGAGVALIAAKTTGVTGRGGVVSALVRLDRWWRREDRLSYSDPNVACGRPETARWIFINANHNPPAGENRIFGWVPLRERIALPPGADPPEGKWKVRSPSGQVEPCDQQLGPPPYTP